MTISAGRPEFRSYIETLRHHAALRPDQTAYIFLENGEIESGRLTYRELDIRARGIAARLQAAADPGDRVLLLYPPGLEFICAFLGCLYAGMIAVPAYAPRQNRSAGRLQSIASDCSPILALTTVSTRDGLKRRAAGVQGLEKLQWIATDDGEEPHAGAWIDTSADWDTLAFLQYTSGSTGTPKGVMVSHGNLLHNSEMIRTSFGHDESTIFATWLPLFHDMGLIGNTLHPLHLGICSVLMEPAAFIQKPVRWLQAISRYRATTTGGPNSAYDLCVRKVTDEQKADLDLSSLRIAYNGSEPVRAETLDRFAAAFGGCGLRPEALYPCYGLAEATLLVTGSSVDGLPVIGEFDRRLVSSGRASIGCTVAIVDPERHVPVEDGGIGEIWVAGPHIAHGYWNRAEETARTFGARLASGEGPFLRTGDLGFRQNEELFVTGRLKDLLIIRGRNHYPQDIELTAERSHPALTPNGVAAVSVEVDGEERPVLVCEVNREHLRKLDTEAVAAAIRRAVAEEHDLGLHAILLLKPTTLPRTSSGKIQRHACRAGFLAGEGLEVVGEWRAPVEEEQPTSTVQAPDAEAIRAWLAAKIAGKARLPLTSVRPGDAFSQYGLDSKDAVALSGELQDWLGKPLSATLLYDYPTIDALARHLTPQIDTKIDSPAQASSEDGIAIIGMASRFPGAPSVPDFWRLLAEGRESIKPGLGKRLKKFGWPDSEAPVWAGLLDEVEKFDAEFFGISRREAEAMDPQQRLLLEMAWESLEDAGIVPRDLAGSRTGVFAGISNSDYIRLQGNQASATEPYAATGNALSVAANRISYLLDLRGPSLAVDTACSSSLVAVHQAAQSLRHRECDLALAGGVNLILAPHLSVMFARAGMLSPDGCCRTFDEKAAGYVRGEGAGMVVLKRLREALRDGDPVLAVIRGSAVNQDGLSNGLTAPNGPAQEAVMREALRKAGAEPSAIGYIEAHGTGTPLGDAMELDSIRSVFRGPDSPGDPIVVGSVKTNIGHLESAAGIAGLIKTVLALQHEEIPPHLHWKRGHTDRVEIPASGKRWRRGVEKRLAGVSSFGFGGTNAHIILEEAPVREAAGTLERPMHIVSLSAKTPAALEQIAERHAEFLRENPGVSIGDFAHTVNCGRQHFGVRRAVVANSVEDLRAKLAARGEARTPAGPPRVAFLYTGQGSQYAGMGRELYETQPIFREALDRCAAILRPVLDTPLLDVIFALPLLDETAYTQPALFALEMALTELWKSWGIQPAIVLGHSVGEYAATCAAGVFSLEDGLKLIAARGWLMQQLPRNGTMVSVFAEEERVTKAAARYADSVSIAAINGPRLVVLSGESEAVDAIVTDLARAGVSVARLTVSHAFHSPLMRPMLAEFERATKDVTFRPPSTPLISNVSGAVAGEEIARPEYWRDHVLAPVRFHAGMVSLDAVGADVLVEIGPKPVLLTMGKRCIPARERAWLPSLEPSRGNWQTLLESLGELYTRGCAVNWKAVGDGSRRQRISGIPTYPFQRERYWLEGTPSTAPAQKTEAAHPLLGRRLERLAHLPGTRVWQGRVRGNLEFIEDHRLLGSAVLPYSAYVEMALAAAAETNGTAAYEIADLKLHQPVFFGENGSAEVQSILTEQPAGYSFQVFRRQGTSDSAWLLCASARLRPVERRLPDEVRADVLCRQ